MKFISLVDIIVNYLIGTTNMRDLLPTLAKKFAEQEKQKEHLVKLAKQIFEPLKKLYKKKEQTGMLWWKKEVLKDIIIEYHTDNAGTFAIIYINFHGIFECVRLNLFLIDMEDYLNNKVTSSYLQERFFKIYEVGRPYLQENV